jgi:hypothetical protein
MADLINAVTLGALFGGAGIVFPTVMIPVYGVARGFLIHSYSLIGLVRKTSRQPQPEAGLQYGVDAV